MQRVRVKTVKAGTVGWQTRHIATLVTAFSTQEHCSPGAQLLFNERDIDAQCADAQQFDCVPLQDPFV